MKRPGNGYLILGTERSSPDCQRVRDSIETALREAGHQPWTGDGFPACVVLDPHARKFHWFEAGYWCGAGVPLITVGTSRPGKGHREAIVRLGGWLISAERVAQLPAVLAQLRLQVLQQVT